MGYLETTRSRFVTVWLPLSVFLFVLLFPFYWMVITTLKPNEELLSREGNPFWVINPTLAHIKKLLFETAYPSGCGTRCWCRSCRRRCRSSAACSPRTRSSGCASAARATSAWRSSSPTSCRRRSCSSRSPRWCTTLGLFDTRLALILTYPTFLIPFCTWLLMGYFKSIPSSSRSAR
jgi:multiple sugar transport system permease protein